jgi:hypothetical protein
VVFYIKKTHWQSKMDPQVNRADNPERANNHAKIVDEAAVKLTYAVKE